MRKITMAMAAATLSIPVAMTLPAAPAAAASTASYDDDQRRYYDRRGNYSGPTWRDSRGRYRCRRSNGTTGLVVGGVAGALIGREVAGRNDRLLGTVVGGAAGALLGREVDRRESGRRNSRGQRCR